MLKIGICDDQPECVEILQNLLRQYLAKNQLKAHITVYLSAEDLLQSDWKDLHILFLDVVMEGTNGIQAALQIRQKNCDVSLIFVSAYLDYATMGYQVKASAYLLKDQLVNTLSAVMDSVISKRNLNQDVIEIMLDNHKIAVSLHQILYIESMRKIIIFHCGCEYRTQMYLSDVEAMLVSKGFLRIQKSYVINLSHCTTMCNYQAILDDGHSLPCSRKDYHYFVQTLLRWKGAAYDWTKCNCIYN